MLLLRGYHCCCENGCSWPLTRVWGVYPPLAQPNPVGVRLRCVLMFIRRIGAACATAHRSYAVPDGGVTEKFSVDRQKFWVALPPNQPASTVTLLLLRFTSVGL